MMRKLYEYPAFKLLDAAVLFAFGVYLAWVVSGKFCKSR